LVPKVVFRVAVGATSVVPVLAGCSHNQPPPNGVAYQGYTVAQSGYQNGTSPSCGTDGGEVDLPRCLPQGVAAIGYENAHPRSNPDAAPADAGVRTLPPPSPVAARGFGR
jgi:hypothetical protein